MRALCFKANVVYQGCDWYDKGTGKSSLVGVNYSRQVIHRNGDLALIPVIYPYVRSRPTCNSFSSSRSIKLRLTSRFCEQDAVRPALQTMCIYAKIPTQAVPSPDVSQATLPA